MKNSEILYKCITANTSVIWQHTAHKQEPYKKAYLLMKNTEEFSGKSLEGPAGKKREDTKGSRTRQKNKR